jgi:hypothetical protein
MGMKLGILSEEKKYIESVWEQSAKKDDKN